MQIDEHVGNATTKTAGISVAHVRTSGPSDEAPQTPAFDEYVLVLKGTMVVNVGVGAEMSTVQARAGQTLWLPKGFRYDYHFPDEGGAEYVPICLPGFAPEIAGRED
jgi:mannose-6-phosphate isomerase-like protein (cupin superfamily)